MTFRARIFIRFATILLRVVVYSFGVFTLFLLILSFTRIPYDVHVWLGTKESRYHFEPDYIIFLGGSGMPSESNLIRLYYVSALAEIYPDARVIITHPKDSSVISRIREELIYRHVDSLRILVENNGANTREQVLKIAQDFPSAIHRNTVVVSSPENMYRTVLTFRKVGFRNIGGQPAFENAMFVSLNYEHKRIGGKIYSPDVSANLALRYNFWNYLKLEITCLREFTALAYYKLNGWI